MTTHLHLAPAAHGKTAYLLDLVLDAARGLRTRAADAIENRVRGNIAYHFAFGLPNDASSLCRNRSGTWSGFSDLTAALLRAAR